MAKLRADGKQIAEIANMYGRSKTDVYNRLRTLANANRKRGPFSAEEVR